MVAQRSLVPVAEVLDGFVDLFGELAGGGDDQGTRPVARTGQQFIQNGQDERGRFAGAGLGGADQVIPGQGGRDGLRLEWGLPRYSRDG